MTDPIAYADIIIMALVAGFILLRLRSVLGQNVGHENPDFFKPKEPEQAQPEPVVRAGLDKIIKPKTPEVVDAYRERVLDETIKAALDAIKAKDAEFSAEQFLVGAKLAFEMVFDGFAKGDKAPLKMLLSADLYASFVAEIDARSTQGNKTEATLVSVRAKDIVRASLSGTIARLTVAYLSEQVTLVRGADGSIVEGNPSEVSEVHDEWTFERDVSSKNPNWTIIDT